MHVHLHACAPMLRGALLDLTSRHTVSAQIAAVALLSGVLTRTCRDDMMEDMRRASDDRARVDRDAAERAGRERAQAHLASLSVSSQGPQSSSQAPPGNWPQPPNNYPPAYQVGF